MKADLKVRVGERGGERLGLVERLEEAARVFACTGSESARKSLDLARSDLDAYIVSLRSAVEAPREVSLQGWRIAETAGGELVVSGPSQEMGSMTLPDTEEGSVPVRLLRSLCKALLSEAGRLDSAQEVAEGAFVARDPWMVDRKAVLSWLGMRGQPLTVENAWRARVAIAHGMGSVQAPAVELTVRLSSFPESNGRRNWTALFVRKTPWGGLVGNCGGITIARGEYWNRVAYQAECARALIGERDTQPHILDYHDDIATPEEWGGEVRGGRKVTAAKDVEGVRK